MTHSSELESLKSVLDYDKDSYLKPLKKKVDNFQRIPQLSHPKNMSLVMRLQIQADLKRERNNLENYTWCDFR